MAAERMFLVDAHGYIHRAFHALPPLTTSGGQAVGAVYGFARMLLKILREERPTYLAVCFDAEGPTFRHKMFAAYKGTRPETDPALVAQFPLTRELVQALNLPGLEIPGYEADDLIATVARRAEADGMDVVLVTGDKDALQLVNDHIRVLSEPKGLWLDAAAVRARYGVPPERLTDLFALAGDATDNVPGVRGIGEKTAASLLQQFGSLDGIYRSLDQVPGKLRERLEAGRDAAYQSLTLVRLAEDAPVNQDPRALRPGPYRDDLLIPLLERMEFKRLLADLRGVGTSNVGADLQVGPTAGGPEDPPLRGQDNYQTILTEDDWQKVLAEIRRATRLAVDTETTSLNPRKAALVGISLAWAGGSGEPPLHTARGRAVYVPVGHRYLGAPEQIPLDRVLSDLRPVLEDPKIAKIGHNLKFDLQVLRRQGVWLRGLASDTMVASYVLDPGRVSHSLSDVGAEFLGDASAGHGRKESIEGLIGKGAKQISMAEVTVERAGPYAARDADLAYRLAPVLEAKLDEAGLTPLYRDVEMPLVEVLAGMEDAGVRVDTAHLVALRGEFSGLLQATEKKMFEAAGEEFNVNSPKQLGELLFQRLGLPPGRRTKTGFSTDEEVMKGLADRHPLPVLVLEYREVQKLMSTYVDSLLEMADPLSGRVHTSFRQTVAVTGRLSSSDPNLQNIPIRTELGRKIRRAFIPEPGCVLLSADYSQIDLRGVAHFSGDPALRRAFSRGEDIHRATAAEIFGVPPPEVTPAQRGVAKAVNFGIVYGISAYGLAGQLKIAQEEAKRYIDAYLTRYEGVKRWMDATIRSAREQGYVTTFLGRRRFLPDILSSRGDLRGSAEREALNTPIQGTSSDIIKVAMVRLHRSLAARPGVRMLIQVHDELVFEAPEGDLRETAALARREMEAPPGPGWTVPLVVDLKAGPNWRDMTPFHA